MNRRHFVKGLGGAGVYALGHPARAAVAPPETTRQRWAATLERLARPVLEALAADQLRQRMPVESQPSVRADRAKYTHLEA
ncbi:MAG: hypothetical protein LH606_19355, partial [Cytophagaceae bacterium]|nr:hypothetical protein [Cytophagaceae bacterium]